MACQLLEEHFRLADHLGQFRDGQILCTIDAADDLDDRLRVLLERHLERELYLSSPYLRLSSA